MAKCYCQCGVGYTVAETSVGKKAKCTQCGAVFVLGVFGASIPIVPRAEVEDEVGVADAPAGGTGAAAQGSVVAPPGSPAAIASIGVTSTAVTGAIAAGASVDRGFWSDVLWTFLFPSSIGNLVKFLVVWGVLVASQFSLIVPCIGIPLTLIAYVWYAAFRFAIIESAVAGESELPDMLAVGDVLDGLVGPFFKWVGSWAVVFVPAFVFLFLISEQQGGYDATAILRMVVNGLGGILTGASSKNLGFDILAYAGICFWPVVVLCIAVGGFQTLYRFDLMVATVFKTLPVYITLLILMVGAVYAQHELVALATTRTATATQGAGFAGLLGGSFVLEFLRLGLRAYADIIVVRLVGLYYHHFKERFAWSWG